jgi:post-segregation antitoxin (ccd killing protein)
MSGRPLGPGGHGADARRDSTKREARARTIPPAAKSKKVRMSGIAVTVVADATRRSSRGRWEEGEGEPAGVAGVKARRELSRSRGRGRGCWGVAQ